MKRIILITGGQRSGKSEKAEQLALSLSDHPIYMATAHIWDDEFRERVRKHQERRGPQWTNIEEEFELSKHDITHLSALCCRKVPHTADNDNVVVLIDCCTLWATNFFFRYNKGREDNPEVETPLQQLKKEFDKFTEQDATYIFVTNEIGLGGVSDNVVQRRFTDMLGWFNQYVASHADEVILMISGLEVKVKG